MRYYSRIRAGRVLVTPPGCGRHLLGRVDMSDFTCSVNGCDRKVKARGWCDMHYRRWRATGTPGSAIPLRVVRHETTACAVEGCAKPRRQSLWCDMHYARLRLKGALGVAKPQKLYGARVVDGRKMCITCEECKPVAEFNRNAQTSDGFDGRCRPCVAIYRRKWAYGLTKDEHEAMMAAQGGACAICGEIPEYPLSIDHCHDSGVVRELLCPLCNNAIGLLGDSADRAMAAADYLRKWAHLKGVIGDRSRS